jgi:hypothetical protein
MTPTREIVFIDPGVAHRDTILGNLRPGVEAILLDTGRPAARQIAAALEGCQALETIHIIAHGAPGRVCFTAGDWSAAALHDDAEALVAIGDALAADGNLRLWSCETGLGPAGDQFRQALADATGSNVSAATSLVGAAALGGSWNLGAHPGTAADHSPLTAAGRMRYPGVLAAFEITITGTLPNGSTTRNVTHFVIDAVTGTIVSQIILPDAVRQNNSVAITVKVPSSSASYAIGTFDVSGDFQATSFLSVSNAAGDQRPGGAVEPSGR